MPKVIKNIIETLILPSGTRHYLLPLQVTACHPLRDANFCVAGLSTTPKGYSVERRAPRMHELLFTLSGKGCLSFSDTKIATKKNDLMVLPANTYYRYESISHAWQIMWFHLYNQGMWLPLEEAQPHVREAVVMSSLLQATEGLISESVQTEISSNRLVTLYAEQIVLYLEREVATTDNPHDWRLRQHLHDLWTDVNAHLQQEWSVETMATRMNMSTAHFHRICLRYAGCSPSYMIFRLRMERAEELLIKEGAPLKIIAEDVGYSSPFSFSNAFKRYKGISPEHYRARLNEKRRLS